MAAFDEQKENVRSEAEEHDGDAGGDAPERAGGRAAVAAATHDDMTGNGHEEFEDAAAQEPADNAFEQRVRSSDLAKLRKMTAQMIQKARPVITAPNSVEKSEGDTWLGLNGRK